MNPDRYGCFDRPHLPACEYRHTALGQVDPRCEGCQRRADPTDTPPVAAATPKKLDQNQTLLHALGLGHVKNIVALNLRMRPQKLPELFLKFHHCASDASKEPSVQFAWKPVQPEPQ